MFWPKFDVLVQEWMTSGRWPRYGLSVDYVAPDYSHIQVELRLLAGRSYCCGEASCHVPRNCERLIRLAGERAIVLPADVRVQWHCIVEAGARLQCLGDLGLSPESKGCEMEYTSGGAVLPNRKNFKLPNRPPAEFTGIWTVNRSDGSRIETEYAHGVRNGIYRSWNGAGVCLRAEFAKNGQRHGMVITRDPGGKVLDASVFDEGTGIHRMFNSHGERTDEIPMLRGKPHGLARRWVLGKLVETRHYVDGECRAICQP